MISGKDLPHVYQKAITLHQIVQMHASSIPCEERIRCMSDPKEKILQIYDSLFTGPLSFVSFVGLSSWPPEQKRSVRFYAHCAASSCPRTPCAPAKLNTLRWIVRLTKQNDRASSAWQQSRSQSSKNYALARTEREYYSNSAASQTKRPYKVFSLFSLRCARSFALRAS